MTTVRQRTGTTRLLTAGTLAGPLYVVVGLAEAIMRSGFDLRRHSLSLLSNGDLGLVHVLLLITTGVLTVLGAVGLRQALASDENRIRRPMLIGIYGLGLILAGLLVADPAFGFPPGTPDAQPATVSWHGIGHLVAGGIGFVSLILACFSFARRFKSQGESGWAAYSLITGVLFLVGFAAIASGAQSSVVNIGFGLTVVIAWGWITALCARFRRISRNDRAEGGRP